MAKRRRGGRTQIDRAGIHALTGASLKTITYWYGNRDVTGFPTVADVGRDGRHWYWLHEVHAFWRIHQSRRTFTPVDRAGHPDDLIGAPEAARVLGYRHRRSLPALLLDHPDHVEILPSGRKRRRWRRRTVWHFADTRHLRHSTGRPPGRLGTGKPHWYAGDPRLEAATRLLTATTTGATGRVGLAGRLAAQLRVHPSTARRLLAIARAIGHASRPPRPRHPRPDRT